MCRLIQVKRCMMGACGNFCRMFHHLRMRSNKDAGGTYVWNYTYLYEVFKGNAIFYYFHVFKSGVLSH